MNYPYRRRDPLAKTRAANTSDRMRRIRENMTPQEVDAAMRKIIREKLTSDEPIDMADFQSKNLPMDQVKTSFQRNLKAVQNELATEQSN